MKIFISGGCKNGKSMYAQKIAKQMQAHRKPLYYLATMKPVDNEDRQRIIRHQQERQNWGFKTIECPQNVYEYIRHCELEGSFLLDSVTALLANVMFTNEGYIKNAYEQVAEDLKRTLDITQNMVIVSDAIYSDAFLYDTYTEQYRYGLAYIDKMLAKYCDVVLEVCYGNLIIYKGKTFNFVDILPK